METDERPQKTSLTAIREAMAMLSDLRRSLGTSPAGKRILWIDDQPANNQLPHRLLDDSGASIVIALSTEEATSILERSECAIALVISDMSRGDNQLAGIEVLKYLQKSELHMPVIIYSDSPLAKAHCKDIHRLGGIGPLVGPQSLIECIKAVLSTSNLNKAIDSDEK